MNRTELNQNGFGAVVVLTRFDVTNLSFFLSAFDLLVKFISESVESRLVAN